jgi:hypothetical protein
MRLGSVVDDSGMTDVHMSCQAADFKAAAWPLITKPSNGKSWPSDMLGPRKLKRTILGSIDSGWRGIYSGIAIRKLVAPPTRQVR